MRRTKEEAEATRQELLRAALQLFSDKGYAATRLDEIADAAGVTRGAIYHHFKNKADLYQTLLATFSGQFDAQVVDAIQQGGSFLEICRRVMVQPLAYLEQHSDYAAFYELVQFRTVAIPELRPAQQQQEAQGEGLLANIAGYFRTGIAQGAIAPHLDPLALARSFLAMQNGLIHLWLVQGRSFSLRAAATTAAAVFTNGIQPRDAAG